MKLILRIPFRLAANFMLVLLLLVFIFHGLVILGLIPDSIVWGGRIQTKEQILVFECVSLFINAALFWIIAQHAGYFRKVIPVRGLKGILWLMSGVFFLNTLGNLLAINPLEKYLFTPLTLASAIFCLRLAIGKKE